MCCCFSATLLLLLPLSKVPFISSLLGHFCFIFPPSSSNSKASIFIFFWDTLLHLGLSFRRIIHLHGVFRQQQNPTTTTSLFYLLTYTSENISFFLLFLSQAVSVLHSSPHSTTFFLNFIHLFHGHLNVIVENGEASERIYCSISISVSGSCDFFRPSFQWWCFGFNRP